MLTQDIETGKWVNSALHAEKELLYEVLMKQRNTMEETQENSASRRELV